MIIQRKKRTIINAILLIGLTVVNFGEVFTIWAEEDRLSSESSITSELTRLKEFAPEEFLNREDIRELLPNEHDMHILFLAAHYCKNEIKELQQEFPSIFAVFHPRIIEDIDNDGEKEIVIDLSGYLSGDVTWFQVADPQNGGFKMFEYRVEGPMMDIIPGTNERKKNIVLMRTGVRKVQIKGGNKLIPLEYFEEMAFIFTGTRIEVVSPRRIVHEQIIMK